MSAKTPKRPLAVEYSSQWLKTGAVAAFPVVEITDTNASHFDNKSPGGTYICHMTAPSFIRPIYPGTMTDFHSVPGPDILCVEQVTH